MTDVIELANVFMIPVEYEEAFSLCSELSQLTPSTEKISVNETWPLFLLNSLAKAQKNFGAILTLCKNGFAEDALILGRTLLEQVIAVKYISLNVERRLWDYLDYDVAMSEHYLEQKLEKRQFLGLDYDIDAFKRNILELKEEIKGDGRDPDRFRDKYGEISNSWSKKSIGLMAEKTGLLWHYDTVYWLACNLSHSNPKGLYHFVETTDQAISFKPLPSTHFISQALVSSFESYGRMLDLCLNALKDNIGLKNLQSLVDKAEILRKLPT